MSPEICPHCGAEVPPKARRCPECGSDEETGWSEDAVSQGLDLPDDNFDYDEFVKKEFGDGGKSGGTGLKWYWVVAALLVVLGLISLFIPW